MPKSYTGNNRQSDSQAARCANPCYYKGEWDEPGIVVYYFVAASHMSPWQAPTMHSNGENYNIEEVFHNSLFAYYAILQNVMVLEHQYGESWHDYTLPVTTIQNALSNCGDVVKRCLYWDKSIPWNPRCQREWAAETHFSELKRPAPGVRGMSKYKDMIAGNCQ